MKSIILRTKAVAIFAIFISGCTNPMDTKITKENYREVVKKVRAKSSPEEIEKMEAILIMAKIGTLTGQTEEEILEGKSFNDVIKNINAKKIEQQEQQKRSIAQSNKLTDFFKIGTWKKESIQGRFKFDQKVRISVDITSKLDKEVGAFEGAVLIFDKLDNELANLPIKMTNQNVEPMANFDLSMNLSYSDLGNNMDEIFSTKAGDLKFLLLFKRVRLADGTDL